MRGYVIRAGDSVPGADEGVKASRLSTSGALSVIESRTDGGAPPHVHSREDESMYVLDGEIVAHVDGESLRAERGDFVFLPRGIEHAWDVVGSRATVLIITAPGGLDEFLHEFHSVPSDQRRAVARRFGIDLR